MHPNLMHDIARYRQADMLREAERARLAALVSEAAAERPHFRLRLRLRRQGSQFPLARPALDG